MEFNENLPIGWAIKLFPEIVNNYDSLRIPLTEGGRINGEYPYYGASGIIDYVEGYLYNGEYLLISEDGANLVFRKYPIAFIAKGKFWVNNHAHVVQAKNGVTTNRFLELCFKNLDISPYITGSAQPKLSQKKLNEIPIPLPPLPEQTRIVAKLDALFERIDKAIALLEVNIKRTGELMGAVLGEVFGEMEQTPQKTLKQLCDKLTDGTHFSPKHQFQEYREGLFKYVTSKNIRWSGLDLNNLSYVTKEVHEDIYKRCNPELGDLLFTKDGAMTGTCCINTLTEPFSLLSSVALLKPNKKLISTKYLYFFFKSPQGRERIFQDISGAAITRTTIAKLNLVQIPMVDLTRQSKIVQYLETCEELTTTLIRAKTQKLHHLKALKSSLLDQAFRGEL